MTEERTPPVRRLVAVQSVAGAARTVYVVGGSISEPAEGRFTCLGDAIREAGRRILAVAREPEVCALRFIQRRSVAGQLVVVAERTDGRPSYLPGVVVRVELEALDPEELEGELRAELLDAAADVIERHAYHPSELPERLKAAVRDARMDPRHDSLNELLADEPGEGGSNAR